MKKILSIIVLSPIILCFVITDIVKLPIILFFVMPLTFLFALSDKIKGDDEWIKNWLELNIELGCITYLMKDDLF